MAKNTCAICGAEVNLVTGQKLADGSYICRKVCGKKCFRNFDKISAHLDDVNEHIAQVEKGTRIFYDVILPLKQSKNKDERVKSFGIGSTSLEVSPSTGLAALVETHYKFFIFGKYYKACVYRIGDLAKHEYFDEETKTSDGKTEKKHYCAMVFDNTPGMFAFNQQISTSKAYNEIEEYFNKLFGIEKTLRNSLNNAKRQMTAIKSVVGAVKAAAQNGGLDADSAAQAMDDVDAYIRGDRTEILAKADAILAKYN